MSDDQDAGLLADDESVANRRPKDWCLDVVRLFDWMSWVTSKGDAREVAAGVFGILIVLASVIYFIVAFSSPSYSDTTALCTCQSLDDVAVVKDADKLVLESFPSTHLVKLCENHGTGQLCSAECLAESNQDFDGELCDAGTFSCTCLAGDTCNSGLQCKDGLCVGDLTATKGNSVAVRFCEAKLQQRVLAIKRLIGLKPTPVVLNDDEMAVLAKHSRCVVGFDACQIPNTVFSVLGVIGSTWGWATLFIIPLIMIWNCALKMAFLRQLEETRTLRKKQSRFFSERESTPMRTMK